MARPTLTAEQIQDFRRRTCEVSMRLFVDQGYDGFSLRALAKELGCSHATPYRYFQDKAEIFAVVRAEGFNRFGAFMRERLEGQVDPVERVRVLARAYFDFAQEHPEAFRVIFELSQPADDYPFVREAGQSAWAVLQGVVREAVEAGVLEGKPLELSHTFWAAIHGVATLQLARRLNMGRSAEDVLIAVTEALLRAHSGQDPSRND